MNYLSQGSPRMYMSQSNLEMVAARAPAPMYSAVAVNSGFSGLSYSPKTMFNSSVGGTYSQNEFISSFFSPSSFEIGKNPSYLSNIMSSYGADPSAVREKHSSLDLMSSVVSSPLTHIETDFHPAQFIRAKAGGVFVAGASQIQYEIQETFEKLIGEEFPSDIKVSILSTAKFRKICPQPGVVGVSYNRRRLGLISEIFVLEGSLASVMLTVGHEIGHVLSSTLSDPALEEAKAYAFSFAWMDVIKKNDIGGLSNAFVSLLPAVNGVHDKGYYFVKKLLVMGKGAFGIYRDLVMREVNIGQKSKLYY